MNGTSCVALVTLGVKDPKMFGEMTKLSKLLADAIESTGLQPFGTVHFQPYPVKDKKKPFGLTAIQCLKESHAAIETYPESALIELTISSCRSFEMEGFGAKIEEQGWAKVVDAVMIRRKAGRWTLDEVMLETRIVDRAPE